MMNRYNHSADMVFNLAESEEVPARPRSLEDLRREQMALSQQSRVNHAAQQKAQRDYLYARAAEHNASVVEPDADTGILIAEDWLAAQTSLQSEYARNRTPLKNTVVLKPNAPPASVPQETAAETDATAMPVEPVTELTVHVYDLPDLPGTRRIKVLSEQELFAQVEVRLQQHLSNAVSGMVRRALQKKLANLSYELQLMLNEETPQMVEDVLKHNLAQIMRDLKNG